MFNWVLDSKEAMLARNAAEASAVNELEGHHQLLLQFRECNMQSEEA